VNVFKAEKKTGEITSLNKFESHFDLDECVKSLGNNDVDSALHFEKLLSTDMDSKGLYSFDYFTDMNECSTTCTTSIPLCESISITKNPIEILKNLLTLPGTHLDPISKAILNCNGENLDTRVTASLVGDSDSTVYLIDFTDSEFSSLFSFSYGRERDLPYHKTAESQPIKYSDIERRFTELCGWNERNYNGNTEYIQNLILLNNLNRMHNENSNCSEVEFCSNMVASCSDSFLKSRLFDLICQKNEIAKALSLTLKFHKSVEGKTGSHGFKKKNVHD